jgi:PKD repeat protein
MIEMSLKTGSKILVIGLMLILILISLFTPVSAQNLYPPVANLNLDTARHDNQEAVNVFEPAYFDGSNSYDPDGSNISYEWDFGDGSTNTGMKSSHVYKKVGFYKVSLTVGDGNYSSTSSMNIIVISYKPHPPMADGGLSQEANSTDDVTLDASNSYDPDGDSLTYIWDFGDGSENGYGVTTTHRFDKEGIYIVTLTVKDYYHSSNDTVVIKVGEGPLVNPDQPSGDDGNEDESDLFLWVTIGIVVIVLVIFVIGWIYSRSRSRTATTEGVGESKRSSGTIQSEIDDLLSTKPSSSSSSRPTRGEPPGGARKVASGAAAGGARAQSVAAAMAASGAAKKGAGAAKGRGAAAKGAPGKGKGRVARTIDVDAYRQRLEDLEKKEEKKRESMLKRQLKAETKKMEKEMEKDLQDLGLEF